MIFKYTEEVLTIPEGYKDAAQNFSFEVLDKLIYKANMPSFVNLQNRIDERLYPDLIASIYRKMYEGGMTKRRTITDALLTCSYNLQQKGFAFLGFITDKDELYRIDKSNDNDFIKEWDFENNNYNVNAEDKSIEVLSSILPKKDFEKSSNIFFVAGCQSFEMLDLRISKASLLVSLLIKKIFIGTENTKIVLSGYNNSKISNSKVQFSNESLIMRNLLIHKLLHDLGRDLEYDFINGAIESEINSRDTNENVQELIKKLLSNLDKLQKSESEILNIFIVSSTFHLLQLSDHIEKRFSSFKLQLAPLGIKVNIFLIGAENPNHFFKIYDAHYIKLLMNEVVHRNFKFCRKN